MEEEKKRETMKGESKREREREGGEKERKAYRRTIPKGWRR